MTLDPAQKAALKLDVDFGILLAETLAPTLESQLTPLASELALVQDKIKTLEEQESMLKTRIRELVPGHDSYAAGNLTVIVCTNNRFDPKKALGLLSETLYPRVVELIPTVNKDKLKALAPKIFEAAQTVGELKVMLK